MEWVVLVDFDGFWSGWLLVEMVVLVVDGFVDFDIILFVVYYNIVFGLYIIELGNIIILFEVDMI